MSHLQFRRIEAYTETCMAKSLRQAYDYWQDQPGLSNATETHTAPWDHGVVRLSSKSAVIHKSGTMLGSKQCPARGTHNLTPVNFTLAPSV